MNVLNTARHAAGLNYALVKVFFPGLLVTFALILLALFLGYRGETIPIFLTLSVLLLLAAPMHAYFIARRDPVLVGDELRRLVKFGEIFKKRYLMAIEEATAFAEDARTASAKMANVVEGEVKELVTVAISHRMGVLQKIVQDTDAANKLRREQEFLEMHKLLRLYEEDLSKLREGKYSIPLETRSELEEDVVEAIRIVLEQVQQDCDAWRKAIERSEKITSEAKRALQQMEPNRF